MCKNCKYLVYFRLLCYTYIKSLGGIFMDIKELKEYSGRMDLGFSDLIEIYLGKVDLYMREPLPVYADELISDKLQADICLKYASLLMDLSMVGYLAEKAGISEGILSSIAEYYGFKPQGISSEDTNDSITENLEEEEETQSTKHTLKNFTSKPVYKPVENFSIEELFGYLKSPKVTDSHVSSPKRVPNYEYLVDFLPGDNEPHVLGIKRESVISNVNYSCICDKSDAYVQYLPQYILRLLSSCSSRDEKGMVWMLILPTKSYESSVSKEDYCKCCSYVRVDSSMANFLIDHLMSYYNGKVDIMPLDLVPIMGKLVKIGLKTGISTLAYPVESFTSANRVLFVGIDNKRYSPAEIDYWLNV